MKSSRESAAIEYLRERTAIAWSAAPNFVWLHALTLLHPRLCGPIPRYAVLRWAVTGDTDCWFWSHFHRLGPCICGCGIAADTYPAGLGQAPVAERHYAEYINPHAHLHPDYEQILDSVLSPSSRQKLETYIPSPAARAYPLCYYARPSLGPAPDQYARRVLCGKGDNCLDHWMRHCLALHFVLLLLIETKAVRGIAALAGENQHGLALATTILFHLRKTILEKKSGLAESPTGCPQPNDPSSLRAVAEHIAGAVVTFECYRNPPALWHRVPAAPRCWLH